MAKLTGNIEFTGSLGGLTAYRMKGCDRIVLRQTVEPSRQKINNNPRYLLTKQNKTEFGGVAKAAKHLRRAVNWLEKLADYNFQPTLNKVTKAIQLRDENSERGQRNILYSQNHEMLKGFNLNKYHLFDTIVRKTVSCTINSETATAVVSIPPLQRGINLNLPWPTPQFCFVAILGICDDLMYQDIGYAENKMSKHQSVMVETDWQPANQPYAGEEIRLQIKYPECSTEHSSLVVSIGIMFDMSHRSFGTDEYLQFPTGSAKILDLAKAIPTAHPKLEIPLTITDPELIERQQFYNKSLPETEEQQGRFTEGFELTTVPKTEEPLPDTFTASVNVHSKRLWKAFYTLAENFPDEGVNFVISVKGVEPVITPAISKRKILESLPPYIRELCDDTSLSFGIQLQTPDNFTELIVTESKYLRFRGADKERFLQTMNELNIDAVKRLRFIDPATMVTKPIHKYFPDARLPETVIQELMEMLKE